MRSLLIATTAAATASIGVGAAGHAQRSGEDAAQRRPAAIEFANLGGIRNWRATGSADALLIEGRNGRWYRATFMNACPQIHFSDELAFVTDPTGDLTRFSSIIADGQRCFFESLERTQPPGEEAAGGTRQ